MRAAVIALVVGIAAAGLAVEARQAPQSRPTFRAAAEFVRLDVSVLDKAGNPVQGLTRADFTVLEDGKPQPVTAFDAVVLRNAVPAPVTPAAAMWTREVPPDVHTNAMATDGRLFVLLMDDAMLPDSDQMIESAKHIALSVIDRLGATDQAAVVFSGVTGASQTFTRDRSRLLAAVNKLRGGNAEYKWGWDGAPPPEQMCDEVQAANGGAPCSLPPVGGKLLPSAAIYDSLRDLHPGVDTDGALREASMRTISSVADALQSAPQQRKVLVYVGPGVPVNHVEAGLPVYSSTLSGPGSIPSPQGGAPLALAGEASFPTNMAGQSQSSQLAADMTTLLRDLQRANVTVYAIDAGGLGGTEAYVERQLSTVPAMRFKEKGSIGAGGEVAPGYVPNTGDLAHFVSKLDTDFLEETAANTGGKAIINTNDFESGIASIFRENDSYYALGYQAPDPGSGRLHRLSVKVNRADVEVRTRTGHFTEDAKDAKKKAAAPLTGAISGVLPMSDLPMDVAVAPFMTQGKNGPTGTVAIVLGMSQYAPSAAMAIAVDLQTSAFTEEGDPRGSTIQHARVRLLAGGPEDVACYEVLSKIDLKPGRYQLRLGALNHSNDKSGSVFADVEVPDFVKAPLSLSGVLLEAAPSLPAAPRDALTAIGPVTPTAVRVFDAADHVTAFFDLYEAQNGTPTPVSLTTRIVDSKGAVVLDQKDTVGVDSFGAARAVDKRLTLPLAGRARGEYLLTIEASSGSATAKREVRFVVK